MVYPRFASLLRAAFVAVLMRTHTVQAASLGWGLNGNGGDGSWNAATWYDGATNTTWTPGADAVFGGTAGNVDSYSPGPSVSSMTFNTPGYLIRSGAFDVTTTTLTVTTNANATISSTLSGSSGGTLIKNGSASLTVSGSNSVANVQINAGEYISIGSSSLSSSAVVLADSPGVILTLSTGSSYFIGGLSGGGVSGGVVRPDSSNHTVTLRPNAGSFAGGLVDNAPGKLALSVDLSSTFTLTGTNTFSGSTNIYRGTLVLSGNGSMLNSAVTIVNSGCMLRIDNSGITNANRLSDSMVLSLTGNSMEFIGNAAQPVKEIVGPLSLAGASVVTVTQPGAAAASLTFAGLARTGHATLNFTGASGTAITGVTNQGSGLAPTYLFFGNEWATVNASGRIEPATNYGSNINSPGGDNVKLTSSASLATPVAQATLNLQGSATLDLSGNALTLTQGGILTSGGASTIANGSLSNTNAELAITNHSDLVISAVISGTDLTKAGAGTLTLSGNNSYSGTTAINEGSLFATSAASLGTGSTIEFGGGTLTAGGSFVSTKNLTATVVNELINTNGFDVSFSGTNSGFVLKSGAGKLTLTTSAIFNATVTAGTLALPNAVSGRVSLNGGTLLAAGVLDQLVVGFSDSTLDLGGDAAASLSASSFSPFPGIHLTIRYGVGSGASDQLTLGGGFPWSSPIIFDFADLGGVQTGVSYTLINTPNNVFTPSVSVFSLSPAATAAGWRGTFSTTNRFVKVQFTSVPEPSSSLMICLALSPFLARRSLLRTRRNPAD